MATRGTYGQPLPRPYLLVGLLKRVAGPGGFPMAYRRRHNSDTWHWCRNCSRWPVTDYERRNKPADPKDLCASARLRSTMATAETAPALGANAMPPPE